MSPCAGLVQTVLLRVGELEREKFGGRREVAKAAFSSGFTCIGCHSSSPPLGKRLNRKERKKKKEINNYSTLIENLLHINFFFFYASIVRWISFFFLVFINQRKL